MKLSWFCAVSLVAGVAHAQSAAAPGKVYVSPDGVTVSIVPSPSTFGKNARPDNGAVLIRIQGSSSAFDDKVIPHDAVDQGYGNLNFTTKYRGRPFVTIPVRDHRYTLYVPGGRDGVRLVYDEKKSHELKADELYRSFQRQQADGTLAALQSFNRKAEVAAQDQQLRASAEAFEKSCGGKLALDVNWSSMSDDDLMTISIASYCGDPISTMQQMCNDSAEAKKAIGDRLRSFRCALGKAAGFELTGTTLAWTTSRDVSNVGDLTKAFLERKLLASASVNAGATTTTTTTSAPANAANGGALPRGAESPPWGQAQTLGERTTLEKTAVCTDGRSHYVVVAPHDRRSHQLYYGDGKTFFHVPLPEGALSGESFFEPRFFARDSNPDFRGVDMRLHGSVDLDEKRGSCTVSCGDRKTKLEILGADVKTSLLTRASYAASPHRRRPHHLARDKAGNYYYVDRGNTPDTEKDFHLFVGPKGRMKLQKMTNVVADTEGEIFETRGGSLRYIVTKAGTSAGEPRNQPLWIKGKGKSARENPLLVVPIEGTSGNPAERGQRSDNYGLIYNELGVYLGDKLGNPCDDF